VHVDPRTRLLVAPLPGDSLGAPWSVERLAPLLPLRTVDSGSSALALCRALLVGEGTGHTAVVHTRSRRRVREAAAVLPVSRLLVNAPASQGCVGMGTGLTPSFTLGCGAAGGTSTTDNVSYEHLLDVVRVAAGRSPSRWALPAWGRRR
jgi:acyl-CoA reductase-like NAD-dependent aldehyde dehydrogenase